MQKKRSPQRVQKACNCYSGKPYRRCCRSFIEGKAKPETAEQLMRSRYTAYARADVEYVIKTTHPTNDRFKIDPAVWRQELHQYMQRTRFVGLKILLSKESEVVFHAEFEQEGQVASFTEHSQFIQEGGRWFYASGKLL